jgi:signal peptidase I
MYLVVFCVCNLLVLPASVMYTRAHFIESFRVPAVSMEPTILQGDILFADKRYNCRGCKSGIRRGDIVVFTYPNDRTMLFVKRIIALPGDKFRMDGRNVVVNGTTLAAPGGIGPAGESTEQIGGRSWQVRWGASDDSSLLELTVPAGQVLVMGDNRGNSLDSRFFGTVPMEDVIGRVRQVWFSSGSAGVRWGRIGTALD